MIDRWKAKNLKMFFLWSASILLSTIQVKILSEIFITYEGKTKFQVWARKKQTNSQFGKMSGASSYRKFNALSNGTLFLNFKSIFEGVIAILLKKCRMKLKNLKSGITQKQSVFRKIARSHFLSEIDRRMEP